MSIRIYLIDEHGPARDMLARRLASVPGLDVVGATYDSGQGLQAINELHPDLVLIDTKMKQASGIDVCRRACDADRRAKIAVLTSYIDPDERRLAYEAGVAGYLLKEGDTGNLADWIKLIVGNKAGPGSPETNETG